ncbi:hypothetical protein HETIRDRAFT_29644, partial [Heterobasidion irregulare TC 32-1]
SDDGTIRIYQPPEIRVAKAIRGLGAEISSIACSTEPESELGIVWLACGKRIMSFDMTGPKMILSLSDASTIFDISEDDEDVLNEIMLNPSGKYLAFSTDSGTVGTVEIATKKISRMKSRHDNICGSVAFIPDRPSELVSGGYDSALLHFDFHQGNVLSRIDFTSPPPSSGISLSPPFILSLAMSASGLIAAGTADGRVWIGGGGEKRSGAASGKKKRNRKWEGLKDDEAFTTKIAEGPVVAVCFLDPMTLLTCTLLGTFSQHTISRVNGKLVLETAWTVYVKGVAKVNALVGFDGWIAVGGFGKDGEGLVEMW